MVLILKNILFTSKIILGSNGIEKIVEIKLSDSEKAHLQTSADGVKKTNSLLDV